MTYKFIVNSNFQCLLMIVLWFSLLFNSFDRFEKIDISYTENKMKTKNEKTRRIPEGKLLRGNNFKMNISKQKPRLIDLQSSEYWNQLFNFFCIWNSRFESFMITEMPIKTKDFIMLSMLVYSNPYHFQMFFSLP